MADSSQMFTGIGYTIENLLSNLQQMSLNNKMQQLQLIVSAIITLSIMYKGYMVLAGKSQDPIRELVWDLGRKAFILSFAMGAGVWLNYSIEAVKGIYEWAGGGIGFYQQLDGLVDAVLKYMASLWKESGMSAGKTIMAAFMIVIVGICFVAICFELFFSIIACSVSNTFLIIVLPLALFCLMWNQTKQVFTQWCQLLLSNTFTLLFLFMFMSFCQSVLEQVISLEALKEFDLKNILLQTLEVTLMCFVLVQIIKVIKSLAQNLAQVSLDSAMSGVGASQVAGAVVGGATRGINKAAIGGIGGLTGKSVGSAMEKGGLAGVAGNLATSGMVGGIGVAATGAKMAASAGKALLSKMRG
ncbi:type IV secretion system protein [Helicobacter typhlonius]|uniref:type IV secretion system protein n=1 Tax=Helicobacter typhlonius TaxID=76936 RepID=UPI002FE025E2